MEASSNNARSNSGNLVVIACFGPRQRPHRQPHDCQEFAVSMGAASYPALLIIMFGNDELIDCLGPCRSFPKPVRKTGDGYNSKMMHHAM